MHLVIYSKGNRLALSLGLCGLGVLNCMNLLSWIGLDGLDKSESLVRSKFQEIRNTDRSCIRFTGQPCDSESLQVSLEHLYALNLTYQVVWLFSFPFLS